MNDTYITVTGNVVDEPSLRRTRSNHVVANFRLASTPRRFDREKQAWVDGPTLYINITAWRTVGEHVRDSLHRGDPVVVYGRYHQREYVKDEKRRAAYELEAISLGHDLSRGTTVFTRASRPAPLSVDLDDEGVPVDAVAEYLELAERPEDPEDVDPPEGVSGRVDVHTGEVRSLAEVS